MCAEKTKILIGSPIFQKPNILDEFLKSLDRVDKDGLNIEYMFVDDNVDEASKALLEQFKADHENVHLVAGKQLNEYKCDETTHYWNDDLMNKVGEYKDRIIEYAVENNFDYLFFIDSDLVINKRLIKHLLDSGKDIVSEIFWTKWTPQSIPLPNVWLYDQYNLAPTAPSEQLGENELVLRKLEFLARLRVPGIYKVGGLGACTLISRQALVKGARFKQIENLRVLRGEDRFFCIRAAVLDIELFVDTHYPAYHIYREAELDGLTEYILKNNSHV